MRGIKSRRRKDEEERGVAGIEVEGAAAAGIGNVGFGGETAAGGIVVCDIVEVGLMVVMLGLA